jgi:uncharacterized protein
VKVVLDTNTIVSGIGWSGPPRAVLIALRLGRHTLVTSPAILDEVTRVLTYHKLRPVASHPDLPVVLAWLHRPEHVVVPVELVRQIVDDPADNHVLEAALAATADAIISGDRHLLSLGEFRRIPILTARQFAERYL